MNKNEDSKQSFLETIIVQDRIHDRHDWHADKKMMALMMIYHSSTCCHNVHSAPSSRVRKMAMGHASSAGVALPVPPFYQESSSDSDSSVELLYVNKKKQVRAAMLADNMHHCQNNCHNKVETAPGHDGSDDDIDEENSNGKNENKYEDCSHHSDNDD